MLLAGFRQIGKRLVAYRGSVNARLRADNQGPSAFIFSM